MKLFGWFRRKPPAPVIQPFRIDNYEPLRPKDPGIVVTESELTKTGMFRIFPWLKDREEPKE